MPELVSPCCGKPVRLNRKWVPHLPTPRTYWYECRACGKRCDPVHASDAHVAEVQKSREEWEKRWVMWLLRDAANDPASKDAKDEEPA